MQDSQPGGVTGSGLVRKGGLWMSSCVCFVVYGGWMSRNEVGDCSVRCSCIHRPQTVLAVMPGLGVHQSGCSGCE